jgi:hypothetical protein
MTFKHFLVAALIGFTFYLLLLPRVGYLRKGVILAFVMLMLVFAIQPDWSSSVANAVGISRGPICCSTCRTGRCSSSPSSTS